MSGFLWKEIKEQNRAGAEITGYEGELPARLIIPAQLGTLPVRRIGKFAFEGQHGLTRVRLPESVETLALFAFQNCDQLESLELYNTTQDYYDGVIRGCTALKDVTVHCVLPENYIIVREMLRDTDGALRFHLLGEPHLELTFPEYVSEAREDTMARAIHFSIEGGGMAYRECVSKHAIDLQAYDQLLPRLTEYDFDAAADICLGRLLCPVSLSAAAREQYCQYLRGHAQQVLEKEIAEQREDAILFLTKENLIPAAAAAAGIQAAARADATRICSILMEYQRGLNAAHGAKKLDLDW